MCHKGGGEGEQENCMDAFILVPIYGHLGKLVLVRPGEPQLHQTGMTD